MDGRLGRWGLGLLQSLSITLHRFWLALFDYLAGRPRLERTATGVRQPPHHWGVFTVQYPEEKLALPERFRSFPVLLYEEETGKIRCTSCGICAKVCPPQCIWIERTTGPDGKPVPEPKDFVIDISICMSCGFCAEYCPFDAIKMDHRYELATYERQRALVLHLPDLLVSTRYYAETHPLAWAEEEAARARKGRGAQAEAGE